MREILFKGKCEKEGDWNYGHLFQKDDGTMCILEKYVTLKKSIYYEIDPETVCQYTGLTDKNGRKIFEGDILSFSQKGQISNGVVKMVDGCFFAIIEGQKCWLSEGVKRYKGKVIGNIFDNPELMQEP